MKETKRCTHDARTCMRRFDLGSPFPFRNLVHITLIWGGLTVTTAGQDSTHLFDMDLEALAKLEFNSAIGLTKSDLRRAPVSMTELDIRDIQQSGARDLNQLLELYVPNAQFIAHHHLQPHLGFRGIISDREDKYLYQVNGRTLNNRMLLGADNERAFPLMGDMHKVSVVRGPASATHGAGALAGVINVETFNGLTFEGADVRVRQGIVDQYTATEIRYGRKFTDESGIFLYYGMAAVQGADSDYFIGRSRAATNGLPANVAGRPYRGPMANFGEAGFDELWHKVHLSYVAGPFEFWTRFVQDGGQDRPMREIYTTARPAGMSLQEWTRGRQFRNRQATATASYKKDLSSQWRLELTQSYDVWWLKDERAGVNFTQPLRKGDEQELFSRAIAIWSPGDNHEVAFGMDYSHEWFYDPSYSDTLDRAPAVADRDWQTDTISFLGEYQWRISDNWSTVLSFRTDKHTYSDWLFSPRAALVFTPTERDTFKIMGGESVRRGGDEELWSQWERSRTIPDPETLRTYELTYERKFNDRWTGGLKGFYQDYEAIGWIPSLYYSSSIGCFQMAGGELEISYKTDKTRISLSQGIVKLVDATLPSGLPAGGQALTAEPYGYGNDLAEWSPLITKLTIVHDIGEKWTANASLVFYSGFPGAKDYADYARTFANPPSAMPVSDVGYDDPYGANLYVNLGLEFRPSKHWTIRVDGNNLAALADQTLSKRNYYFRLSEYSVQPASVTLSARFTF
jgi:outer membrane receptor protein involved in Fe transport